MRRDGKTTRLVDEAIQHLFVTGNLYIPSAGGIELEGVFEELPHTEQMFIDPDHKPDNMAQTNFTQRFISRLKIEHDPKYYQIKKDKYYIHVKTV